MEGSHRDCLGLRLGSAFRRVDRLFNRSLAALRLSHAHAQILLCLFDEGELRVGELAAMTGFEASTASRLCKELARRRLVKRHRDPDDGRAQLVLPASRGEALREELLGIRRRVNERLRRDLEPASIEGLLRAAAGLERLP